MIEGRVSREGMLIEVEIRVPNENSIPGEWPFLDERLHFRFSRSFSRLFFLSLILSIIILYT